MFPTPTISAEDLEQLHATGSAPRLIDARAGGRDQFLEERLKDARYADLDDDLADAVRDASEGGRHPLPRPADWMATLARLGIDPQTPVVTYDAHGGALAAARLWWMLRASGHTLVAVLDGGLQAALDVGYPTSTGEVSAPPSQTPYPFDGWRLPTATYRGVAEAIEQGRTVLDVRSSERFRGDSDPFEPTAGHIPGARNRPYEVNLDDDGRLRSPDELSALYSDLDSSDIVHCGSGVTACHTLLAIERAGGQLPALYVGSWSEWSRRELPVATGED